jgi:DNA-binding NtrC family response regulator
MAEPPDDISTIPYALVVDDDALVLINSCDILEEAGFRFYEAGSGDEAKAVLEARGDSITLLFTDVEMPGKTNGFALAHHVAERWPEIEIIVASGRVKPEAGDMPEKATFISKPFSAQVVHDHLRETLPDGKQPAPLKAAV